MSRAVVLVHKTQKRKMRFAFCVLSLRFAFFWRVAFCVLRFEFCVLRFFGALRFAFCVLRFLYADCQLNYCSKYKQTTKDGASK